METTPTTMTALQEIPPRTLVFVQVEDAEEDVLDLLQETIEDSIPEGVAAVTTNFPVEAKALSLPSDSFLVVQAVGADEEEVRELTAEVKKLIPDDVSLLVTDYLLDSETMSEDEIRNLRDLLDTLLE